MTARLAMLIILFVVASVVSAVVLAVAIWILSRLGLSPGPWALPAATLIGFVGVFFLVRGYVLPPHLAAPAWRAAATLVLWIGVTFAIWQAAMWIVRPIMRSVGFERGTFVILLVCLLATLVVIERTLGSRRLPR
jgi:hypothetical protein